LHAGAKPSLNYKENKSIPNHPRKHNPLYPVCRLVSLLNIMLKLKHTCSAHLPYLYLLQTVMLYCMQ